MKAKKNILSRSISWALLGSLSSFAAISSAQAETVWLENFDAPELQGKGAVFETIDLAGVTAWNIDVSLAQLTASSDWFLVKDNQFEAKDVDGDAVWLSESIDINGKANVTIYVDVSTSGTFESADYFDMEYSIDGGAFMRVANFNGGGSDSHTLIDEINNITVRQDVSEGSSLQIRLTMINNAGSEVTRFDNVMVSANAGGGGGGGGGGGTGPGLGFGFGVTISGACFNCPDLTTVKDAAAFDDANYYSDVIAVIAAEQATQVIHDALSNTLANSHTQLSYSQVWTALTKTDEDPANTDNVILIYKGNSIAKMSNGSGSQSSNQDNWNREHVWAKSHGFPSQSQFGYTDIHHLRPSDISVNASRGNLDFDNSDAPLPEAPLNRVDGDSFEPRDSVKGDIARMALYMDVRYNGGEGSMPDLQLLNSLTSVGDARLGKLCALLAWHNADGVDEFEQRRNAIIYEFQGNRNPFVDHPEWVDTLFNIDCSGTGGGGGGSTGGELFISEYVEGGGFNKAVEIYNPTDAAVDLSEYQLALYSNGGTSPSSTYQLTNSIAAKDVVVIVNANSNVSDALKALADQFSNVTNFNGDDYLELKKGDALVDNTGTFGQRTNWGKDKTLVRKPDVTAGDTNRDDEFVVSEQWIVESKDDFSFLGSHNGSTGGRGGGSVLFGSCGDESVNIGAIQGALASSAMVGDTVIIEGVVTKAVNDLNGYFVQQSASTVDGDSATSDGIFVYHQGLEALPTTGTSVRVIGDVKEHFTRTQLSATQHLECGVGEVMAPPVVTLPVSDVADWEKWEGMQVSFSQDLNVSNSFDLARFGQLTLSNGRLAIPTNIFAANSPQAIALKQKNSRNRVVLDDGSNAQNSDDVAFPQGGLSHDNSIRIGDSVTGFTGVLDYSFNEYRVIATSELMFNQTNPRQALASPSAGNLRVASMNVLNFFNGDGTGNGFPMSRGADNNDEFDRQSAKIVSAISGLNADIIGLMEIENDGYGENSAVAQLARMLNVAHGDNVYGYVNAGSSRLGSDEIAVALVYRNDLVALVGSAATSAQAPFDFSNRQPLAQTFKHIASDEVLTVAVNHFKSKGSCSSATGANQDQNDGQGCWNAMRVDAAQGLSMWLATDPTDSGDPDMLIIGDLNAYGKEDPINRLTDLGYRNLVAGYGGLGAYSYGFGGQLGYLDHALANDSLADQVENTQVWHINADETRALDYNVEFKSDQQLSSYYNTDAYRSSDHDPIIVDISLNSTTAIIGDMDSDGDIDRFDVRAFSARLRAGEPFSLDYDFNQDSVVNRRDVRALMSRCTRNRCAVD